jgi:glucose/arabinose dehydrogenase
MITRRAGLAAAAGAALALAGCGKKAAPSTSATPSTTAGSTASGTATPGPTTGPTPVPSVVAAPAKGSVRVTDTVATGIDVPWGLARLPDGTVLVSSRDDHRIHVLDVTTGRLTLAGVVPGVVSDVSESGEGGLLGIAVSPDFGTDRRVHVYYSTASDNRIGRLTYDASAAAGRRLGAMTVLVRGIPHNVHHNGGRLAFGPDGLLYASTGEAEDTALAQDKGSLGGKILRMTPAGRPAPGNPFSSLVWTYGHRNVQGLAFDTRGRLWASEFGDKTYDELNLIRKGRNYGWPDTQGKTSTAGYTSPVVEWGTEEDSPSGIAYAGGSIWMAALQGERLWRIPLDGTRPVAEPQGFLDGTYGRLRSVLALSDTQLLVTTSNRDGRSVPKAGDDRILLLEVT